jgi:hypothetical protein
MKERKPKQTDETEQIKKPNIKTKTKQQGTASLRTSLNADKYKLAMVPITLMSALVFSWYYNNYLSSLVNKPLDEPRIVDESSYTAPENLDRYWGTYR